jgi:hypothetical protein
MAILQLDEQPKGDRNMTIGEFLWPQNRNHRLYITMIHVAVVIGVVGVLFAFQKQFYDSKLSEALGADGQEFTYVGTHPQAAAQPSSDGKIIRTLKAFNGKIYAGYGDYWANSGPIAITPFDPATNSFAATPELNSATEMIASYRSWNNQLFAPSVDPGGSLNSILSVGNVSGSSVGWRQFSSLTPAPLNAPAMEHVFDSNTLTGSDIWLAGSTGNDAVLYRSTDGGVTWAEMLRKAGSSTYYHRFYSIGVLNGKLYVQAMTVNQSTNMVVAPEQKSNVYSNGAWTTGPSLITSYNMWHAEAFAGKLVYFTWSAADGIPSGCPNVFNGSSVTFGCPASMTDFSIDGTTLYAVGGGKVYSTTDLSKWYLQGTAPAGAISVAASNGKIYIGTSDSKLFSATINTNPSLAYTASGGGTKTSPGKGGGNGGGKPTKPVAN